MLALPSRSNNHARHKGSEREIGINLGATNCFSVETPMANLHGGANAVDLFGGGNSHVDR